MSSAERVQNAPAWLIHYRPFRDTSLIVDIFSQDHGRLSLVSRGSRSSRSKFRGLLRPFMPLQMSWVIRTDLGTLTGVEPDGPPISLEGDALMAGYYASELILKLLHRHDPQPEIFSVYSETIRRLRGTELVAPVLRRFELETLALLGYGLILDHDSDGGRIAPDSNYEYFPERGPVVTGRDSGGLVFRGRDLLAIGKMAFDDEETIRAAGRLLRQVIDRRLEGAELKSRSVLTEMRRTMAGAAMDRMQ